MNIERIKNSIQDGDLEGASQQMLELTSKYSSRFYNEVLGHKAKLKQILTEERKGIVSSETIRIEKNRLISALLELTDEIEKELQTKDDNTLSEPSNEKSREIIFESPVSQVIIQQSDKGDNILEKTMKKEKVIEIGGNAEISAPVVIADSIENSFNTLAEAKVDDDIKNLLDQLLKTINEVNKKATPEQTETAKTMAQDAETLVKESTRTQPRRQWYEISLEGLKDAAISMGEVAVPVLNLVDKISPLLLA
ncbi:MAG: hypothetical protein F6K48_21865 [Okeania sp. SIO3H1]|uniref:hypothetical protein n=1 Tax=Okeania sp. SIO1I7 TaxID=2607772 RepID=UPI0013C9EBE2|nr:hypothetical protein [Okeania sp. SIO1I7]NEN91406.1 hypothetical protein [Okeania sp. SIO3H1]NET28831.1 hypothetical protein [Okeania sp. SIO1I7]